MRFALDHLLVHIPGIIGWALLTFILSLVLLIVLKRKKLMPVYRSGQRWLNRLYIVLVPLLLSGTVCGLAILGAAKTEVHQAAGEMLAAYKPSLDSAGMEVRSQIRQMNAEAVEELKRSVERQQQVYRLITAYPAFTKYLGHRGEKLVRELVIKKELGKIVLELIETDEPLSAVVEGWTHRLVNRWFSPWFTFLVLSACFFVLVPAMELFIRHRKKPGRQEFASQPAR